MDEVTLTIHGDPVAQPRAKATTVNGRARMYTPDQKARPFKQAVACEYKAADGPLIEDGPVGVTIFAVFKRPKSMTKKRGPNPRVRKTTKPDVDNVDKAILDALTGIAWHDDAQVCDKHSEKWIAAGGETPFVRVGIRRLELGGCET